MNLKMKKTLVRDTFIQALFDYSTAPSPLSLPLSLSRLWHLSLSLSLRNVHSLTQASHSHVRLHYFFQNFNGREE